MMAREPNLFVVGNRGGGKSVNMRWQCHMTALAVPGFKYAILRTSFPELRKNHLDFLEDEMAEFGPRNKSYYHKTNYTAHYPNGSLGYYAQCMTDADVKKVLGAEVYLVVFDEAPTFEWEHMALIGASVRTPKGSALIPMKRFLGNPIGESIDELWQYFIDKDVDLKDDPEYRPDEWRSIEMRLEDNPYLDIDQYRKQFSGLPPHFVKAWLEGLRVYEDALFGYYTHKDGKPYHEIRELPLTTDGKPAIQQDWVRIYRAYDHGFYPDPAICLWFAVLGDRVICFKEKTYSRVIAKDIATDIVAESVWPDKSPMRVSETFCDPMIDAQDGSDVVTIRDRMEREGLPLTCSVNDRELFADTIHNALQQEVAPHVPLLQYLVTSRPGYGCPYTTKWLPRMRFDPRHPGRMAAHKHDHGPVATAYFLMSHYPQTRPSMTTRMRKWMQPKHKKGALSLPRLRPSDA